MLKKKYTKGLFKSMYNTNKNSRRSSIKYDIKIEKQNNNIKGLPYSFNNTSNNTFQDNLYEFIKLILYLLNKKNLSLLIEKSKKPLGLNQINQRAVEGSTIPINNTAGLY